MPAFDFSDNLKSQSSSSTDFDRESIKFPPIQEITERVWRAAAGRTPEEKVRRAKLAKAIKPVVTGLYGQANVEAFKRDGRAG